MNILSVTPGEFQAASLAWLGAVTAFLTAVAVAVPVLVAKVGAALEAIKGLESRVQDHSARITDNTKTITNVALQVPAPNQTQNETQTPK